MKCKDPGSPTISCRIGDRLIKPALNASTQIHVILGCPFLATSNALINCWSGVMKISFGNMTVELNIFDISKQVLDK